MAIATLRELIEAGAHFGSRASRWHPKMAPYIHSKKNGVHIIDLRETLKGIIRSYYFLKKVAAEGKQVLFVGTKRQAAEVIRQEAQRAGAFFVATRWLGGTLTNMNTNRNRILRLEELEALEASGELQEFSKKMIASLTRERKKIARNFEGIRNMKELPGALVIVDPGQEHIAVKEAIKTEVPIVAIVDTDTNPEDIDFVIPANDDAVRSIQYIISKLADAVIAGRGQAIEAAALSARAAETSKAQETETEAEAGITIPEDFSKVASFSMGGDE